MEKDNDDLFDEFDKPNWEEPERHALVKENKDGLEYYTIYQIKPIVMFMLCDDMDYAARLANKMIQNGVRVFDTFEDMYSLYRQDSKFSRKN